MSTIWAVDTWYPLDCTSRSLQFLFLNEEFLVYVSASHHLTLITSLPYVHTARRYCRLKWFRKVKMISAIVLSARSQNKCKAFLSQCYHCYSLISYLRSRAYIAVKWFAVNWITAERINTFRRSSRIDAMTRSRIQVWNKEENCTNGDALFFSFFADGIFNLLRQHSFTEF